MIDPKPICDCDGNCKCPPIAEVHYGTAGFVGESNA